MQYHVAVVGVFILATAYGSVATAQDQGAAGGTQAERAGDGLEEIVVTAQRRAESAQDVPISVAAFSADQMAKVGLSTTNDLSSVIPGLVVFPTGNRSPLYVRGIGNNSVSTSPEVLTFVDGVYQPFDDTGTDFSNVQSIELAKGPQGTLFGRNATGGVLQITTKNPFDWQGLDAQLGYANYETYSAKIYGSAKLSQMLAADIAGFYDDQREGWGVNRADGSQMYKSRRQGVRSKWVARVGDSFTATLVGDYTYFVGQLGVGVSPSVTNNLLYNSITASSFTLPSHYDVLSDSKPGVTSKEGGGALTLEEDLGDIKLLSISSYRGVRELGTIDFDGTATRIPVGTTTYPVFTINPDLKRTALTQELQASGTGGAVNWAAGLYYYYAKNDEHSLFSGFVPSLPFVFNTGSPAVPLTILAEDTTHAYAGYGQATIGITSDTHLTLGARYTIEKRQLEGHSTGSITLSPGSAGTQEATFEKPNFRVALDHKLTPDILAYASWSRAFNAGFFNLLTTVGFNDTVNPVVQPEVIDAYEIGIKNDLLDRRLRVNVAAFLYNYSNLQQQIFQFGQIQTINAASAQIKGIDLDIVARPMRDLTLSVSANFLDSKYRSYPLAPSYQLLATGEFAAVGSSDAAGKELVNAPRFGLQASATYTVDTSIGPFDTTAHVNYQSRFYADAQNDFPIPERTLIGLTEQWTSNDGNTSVTGWVKNLTDKVYDGSYSLLTPVGLVGNPGAPRTFGVTLDRKF